MSEAQAPRAPAKGPSGARPAQPTGDGGDSTTPPGKLGPACRNYLDRQILMPKRSLLVGLGDCLTAHSTALRPAQERRYLATCPPAPCSASCTQTSPSFLQQASPPSSAAQQVPPTLDVDPSLPPHRTTPCLFPTTSPPWATRPPVSASRSNAHANPQLLALLLEMSGPPPSPRLLPATIPNRHESRARARTCACSGASWLATPTATAT